MTLNLDKISVHPSIKSLPTSNFTAASATISSYSSSSSSSSSAAISATSIFNFNTMTISQSPFTVAIEGNIGTGKSTAIQFLQDYFGPTCFSILEPIEKWSCYTSDQAALSQAVRWGHLTTSFNLLQSVYKDPRRNAFKMCMETLIGSAKNHVLAIGLDRNAIYDAETKRNENR